MTTGFKNYWSGDAATMPTNGRPFQLACTDCGMIHSLIHTVDDDGNVKMAVYVDPHLDQLEDTEHRSGPRHFVTDAGARQPRPQQRTSTMKPRTAPRRYRHDDPDAYGPDGLLKDNCAITVPLLEMRDSQRNDVPMIINTGLPRSVYDGIPGVTASSDARRRRRTVERDPMGREVASFEEADASPHRPGFRTTDAARSASIEARDEMIRDLTTAWMSPEQKAQRTADAQRAMADACPAGVSEGAWERARMIRELTDSWRPKDTDTTKEGTAAPKVDGLLRCRPLATKATRVEPTNPSTDAQPGTRAYVDACWRSYCDDMSNAWKAQG
jgi:hypothetical protein